MRRYGFHHKSVCNTDAKCDAFAFLLNIIIYNVGKLCGCLFYTIYVQKAYNRYPLGFCQNKTLALRFLTASSNFHNISRVHQSSNEYQP